MGLKDVYFLHFLNMGFNPIFWFTQLLLWNIFVWPLMFYSIYACIFYFAYSAGPIESYNGP